MNMPYDYTVDAADNVTSVTRTTVSFSDAKVGDESFVYSEGDALITEYGWVTELEWFDERDCEIRLKRQRWRLVDEDELVLPDPYPVDDEESSS